MKQKQGLRYLRWAAVALIIVLLVLHWIGVIKGPVFYIAQALLFFGVVLPINLIQARRRSLQSVDWAATGLVVVLGIVILASLLMRPNHTKTAIEAVLNAPNPKLVSAYADAQQAKVTNHETTAFEQMRRTLSDMGLTADNEYTKSCCEGNDFITYHTDLALRSAKATVLSLTTEGAGEKISFTAQLQIETVNGTETKEVRGVAVKASRAVPGGGIKIIELTD